MRGTARRCVAGIGLHKLDSRRGPAVGTAHECRLIRHVCQVEVIGFGCEALVQASGFIRGPVVNCGLEDECCWVIECSLAFATVAENIKLRRIPEIRQVDHTILLHRSQVPADGPEYCRILAVCGGRSRQDYSGQLRDCRDRDRRAEGIEKATSVRRLPRLRRRGCWAGSDADQPVFKEDAGSSWALGW